MSQPIWKTLGYNSPAHMEEVEEREHRARENFIVVNYAVVNFALRPNEHIVCDICSALVWDWRKHRTVCK